MKFLDNLKDLNDDEKIKKIKNWLFLKKRESVDIYLIETLDYYIDQPQMLEKAFNLKDDIYLTSDIFSNVLTIHCLSNNNWELLNKLIKPIFKKNPEQKFKYLLSIADIIIDKKFNFDKEELNLFLDCMDKKYHIYIYHSFFNFDRFGYQSVFKENKTFFENKMKQDNIYENFINLRNTLLINNGANNKTINIDINDYLRVIKDLHEYPHFIKTISHQIKNNHDCFLNSNFNNQKLPSFLINDLKKWLNFQHIETPSWLEKIILNNEINQELDLNLKNNSKKRKI